MYQDTDNSKDAKKIMPETNDRESIWEKLDTEKSRQNSIREKRGLDSSSSHRRSSKNELDNSSSHHKRRIHHKRSHSSRSNGSKSQSEDVEEPTESPKQHSLQAPEPPPTNSSHPRQSLTRHLSNDAFLLQQRDQEGYPSKEAKEGDEVDDSSSPLHVTKVCCVLLLTTAGLIVIVLWAFGAAYKSDEMWGLRSELEYLLEDPSAFDDLDSPQSLALNWLIDDVLTENLDDQTRIETRFSLAVFYFATGRNQKLKNDFHFLSSKHECDWIDGSEDQGVFCDSEENVIYISFRDKNLVGTLPFEISALSMLRLLDLSNNRLYGTIPYLSLERIESINLKENELVGSIPMSLWGLSTLRIINLSSNLLTSTLPSSLGKLSILEMLDLGNNNLGGSIVIDNTLNMLQELNLTSNTFSGSIEFIDSLSAVERLDLTSNSFTGRIPAILGGMDYLQVFAFSNNQFFGNMHTSLGLLGNLQYLAGANNQLKGGFPWSSFSTENSLTHILMSGNSLAGSLPPNIDSFSSLKVIDFARNHISGTLPERLGNLFNLEELNMPQNSLQGEIPTALGFSETLSILDLSENSLFGTIPATIGQISTLRALLLDGNQLSGTVPSNLDQLFGIGNLDFLCTFEPSEPTISADCAGEPPKITCDCCYLCLK